ncbi:hypothetical protein [Enterobacter kobei]|uniref:hypothetical protein n=1 Tax=Enterobacter kobei TaxID=208224 RepID=UPI0018A5A540|nr:hypothetical protein [Enterobacter kobei]BBV85989.1 hypothetical protein STW0522ENT62_14350 [Enterobacter kobei]
MKLSENGIEVSEFTFKGKTFSINSTRNIVSEVRINESFKIEHTNVIVKDEVINGAMLFKSLAEIKIYIELHELIKDELVDLPANRVVNP